MQFLLFKKLEMNAVERAVIAKYVSDYIIDTFLVEEALNALELTRLVRDITNDLVSLKVDVPIIAALAKSNVMIDPRVKICPRGNGTGPELWFTTESSRIENN